MGGAKFRGRHELEGAARNAFAVARTTQRADGPSCNRERQVTGSCTAYEEDNRSHCKSCCIFVLASCHGGEESASCCTAATIFVRAPGDDENESVRRPAPLFFRCASTFQ